MEDDWKQTKALTDNRTSQGNNNDQERQTRHIPQDAELIRPAESKSFADITKQINAMSAEQNEMKIQKVLRAESGNVLVKL